MEHGKGPNTIRAVFPQIPSLPDRFSGPHPQLMTWKELQSEARGYEDIWEQEARWVSGRAVLTNIVRHWLREGMVALTDPSDATAVVLTMPLPTILDELSGQSISILNIIPDSLKTILLERINSVMVWRQYVLVDRLSPFYNHLLVPATLAQMKAALDQIDSEARSAGFPETWQLGAVALGMDYLAFRSEWEI